MFDSTSKIIPDPNPSLENTIIVSTSHVQKVKQKRYHESEFKKGCQRVKASNELDQTRRRVMITFENEAGYKLLLEDTKELSKLKKNSYLDLAFLQQNNQYRVHLYYKPRKTVRFGYWARKYPGVKKIIEKEKLDVRNNVNLENNSLSKAIGDIQTEIDSQKALSPKNSPHENPPPPPEYIKGKKKVKVRDLDYHLQASDKKTKDQLRLENEHLKAELEQKNSELIVWKNYLMQIGRNMNAFFYYQGFISNTSSEPIKTLSPTNKNKYENMSDNKEEENKNNIGNLDDNASFIVISSPKSSVPTESEFSS